MKLKDEGRLDDAEIEPWELDDLKVERYWFGKQAVGIATLHFNVDCEVGE